MPEETPAPSPTPKKRNERTEAKFLEDADKVIAEAVREGAEYKPPNAIAALTNLNARRAEVLAKRTANQSVAADLETARNQRENLYKPLRSDVRSLVDYAKASGKPRNEIDALNSIAREIGGRRAAPRGEGSVSVSHLSYATLADNYSRFIEQYDSLGIETDEAMYEADTHRARLNAMRAANQNVITLEAAADTSGEALDKAAYTDADSLLNGCILAKAYIKSKYKGGGAFKNISKTVFIMPSRLR